MLSTLERVLFLKGVSLFEAIPGEELVPIAQISEEVEFSAGETIFREGEAGDCLYLVVAGSVQVHRGGRLISELREGECFGEMALLDPAPRSATVTALEHLLALRIYQEDFSDLLAERPAVMQGILKVLVRRLRKAIE